MVRATGTAPGPGSYTSMSVGKGPNATIGNFKFIPHVNREEQLKPGPASYNNDRMGILPKSTVCKIGNAVRFNLQFESLNLRGLPAKFSPRSEAIRNKAAILYSNGGRNVNLLNKSPSPDSFGLASRIEIPRTYQGGRTTVLETESRRILPGAADYDVFEAINL